MTTNRSLLCLAATALFATSALGAPCSGFTDVDSASSFCPNVDWLKNRAITLGCTSTTLFCPGAAVTRLSMAAFMNRLGTALTPNVLFAQQTIAGGIDLDNPAVVCTLSPGSSSYPRSAQVGALISGLFAAAGTMTLTVVQSTNGGATWTPVHSVPASVGGANKWVNGSVRVGDVPLAVGTNYSLGLQIGRAAGGGTGDVASYQCQLKAVVTSRTGGSAPY